MKMFNINGWYYLEVPGVNIFIRSNFKKVFNTFWNNVMNKLDDNTVIGIILKIQSKDGAIRTLGPLSRVTKGDRTSLSKVLWFYICSKGDDYSVIDISKITFQYIILGNKSEVSTEISNPIIKPVSSHVFGSFSFPLSTDLLHWGKEISRKGDILILENDLYEDVLIEVSFFSDKQVYEFFIDNKLMRTITDFYGSNSSSFIRVIDNQKFIVSNGVIVFKSVIRRSKFISKLALEKVIRTQFLTLDIETRMINNIHTPYCISIFDGNKAWSFYLSDYSSIDDMMNNAIKSIMLRKYNGWNVYVHNGSRFDYIFLLKYITLLGSVQPLIREDLFINIKLSWTSANSEYFINFRDSLLMLPSSLRKLGKSFGVESKGHFPFSFVNNPNINLDYVGVTPSIDLFEEISSDEYNSIVSDKWNLRNEVIHYCELDCKVLHQVLTKFNELIYNKWNLNIHRFPTLSSIAFAIFRSNYLGNHKLPKLGGDIYDFIKESYTGGRVDVFIPEIPKDQGAKYYDVNSLYPTVYSQMPMPVGNPTWFSGNILDSDPQAFGFFRCNIIAPKDMNIPILQTKIKTNSGFRTVAPLGQWSGVYFSEEIKLAMSYGYQIEVIEGYTFDRDVVFNKYANDMFSIKSSHNPSDPMYLISKLLLNSLYGRFGMSIDNINHKIVSSDNLTSFISNVSLVGNVDLNNGYHIISYKVPRDFKDGNDISSMNVSIGIAAAITAYARNHMQQYLQDNRYKVYYTDTDSAVISDSLDSKHVGKGLGQMKLEYDVNKGVFLAPKVYSIVTNEGKVITKVKGLKDNNIDYSIFESLLSKDSSVKLNNQKWFRSIASGSIEVKDQLYELSMTENKRHFIFDKSGKVVDTKPFVINRNKEIVG
jgi:hypothetical protein